VLCVYAETLTEYLDEAKILSSQGKYGDALNAYNKAIGIYIHIFFFLYFFLFICFIIKIIIVH